MKIERIDVTTLNGGRRAKLRVAGIEYSWPFHDLVEFSDGLQDVLLETERLVPMNAARPQARDFMQLEGIRVSDSVEHNRNMVSAREVKERRAAGEHLAAGAWYAEISVNGSDTDCSFDTVEQLFQIAQGIIKREMALHGQIIVETPAVLVHGRH